ncbi:multiple epidermal growth factor-like domains protein 6 isoform X3 [Mizuhopecten yessoensis]|uniref:multiple epidermal growth factor-like domains protein 6 isoform X3 n=1 Tax=Mizuhopecten yessoensis TaxID=6573 RepID=UPI000B4573A1|nr:multiple epidermal growth factor-like domains protein 6 isoform X3 [Mizuhopecten yessoensis]
MYMKALFLVLALSLVSGNVLYFKPHTQQDEIVMEFDEDRDDSLDVIVHDLVEDPESRVPPKEEPAISEQPFNGVMCPGGMSECPDDTTCCILASGRYGCCPYPEAVCCSDMKHCCRQGYTCDLTKGCCVQGDSFMPLMTKLPAFQLQLTGHQNENTASPKVLEGSMIADAVEICPGGDQSCASGYSCCMNTNGTYSCCGYSPAHCCDDKVHCCPASYKCLSSGLCEDKNGFQLPWTRKVEATALKVKANIVCPDKSQCTEGKTCCMKGVNIYGCCPLRNAVCCTDKKHCCPYGYKCGPKIGTCMQGYHVTDLSMETNLDQSDELTPDHKVAVKETVLSTNIVCPDGQSECKTGQTCCREESGRYGCCPIPQAVCCADMKHCCPEGTQCATGAGKCIRGNGLSVDWLEKTESRPVATLSDVICPGGKSECPSGNTCCLVGDNKYGCCPRPNAVCCADMKHCCPEGKQCDTGAGTCTGGNGLSMEWLEKTESRPVAVLSDVICPDGKSECPSGNTCCLVGEDKYGCCPRPNAVCCADMKHCCPEGKQCDTGAGTCTGGNGLSMEWLEKTESRPVAVLSDVICPDGKSECPSGNTCCLVGEDKYGCCPRPNAVCCADMKHCCPEGKQCDTGAGTCTGGNGLSMEWLEKTESRPVAVLSDVICPDGKSECPSGNTCCLVGEDKYGCCPRPNAVCCADMKHCCPEGKQCDTGAGTCTGGNGLSMEWLEKTESRPVAVLSDVICPDGKSECPSGNTCCLVGEDKYGCCPRPNAVCCADMKHCCPEGKQCDTGAGTCTGGNGLSMDWLEKTEGRPVAVLSDVICPDGKSECPSGNTCCLVGEDKYGCCPRPNAECCADKKHCCPQGYECETGQGKCTKGDHVIDWLEKSPSSIVTKSPGVSGQHLCPDHLSVCEPGQTCCKMTGHLYGCCPFPQGVCCGDNSGHCCPAGYTCNVQEQNCRKDGQVIEFTKVNTISVQNVVCPDKKSECPTGNTCCLGVGDRYGCCPLPNAVCCADGKHCCPENTKCDTGAGKCIRGNGLSMDWLEKTESRPVATLSGVVCPDGKSECPSGSTCCLVGENKYGCCPQPNAVCCADGKHCCPENTKCDTGAGKCIRGNGLSMDWLEKTESRPVATLSGVVCPDGKSECPSGSTCCLVGENKYGCCPQPNAVCCADGKHCCPENTKCDTGAGKCIRGNGLSMDWLEKTESRPVATLSGVVCPDGKSECPSGSTCCLVGENKYGCCPQPNAVCCTDGKHCCPENTKCDTGAGKCIRGTGLSMDWLEKTESRPVASLSGVVFPDGKSDEICPGGKSTCPLDSTCCLTVDGAYGCCPRRKAVCCEDRKHCCPENTKCDTTEGKCVSGNSLSMDWLETSESVLIENKSPSAAVIVAANSDIKTSLTSIDCPGGGSCPDSNTCCKDSTGKEGCCPYAKAVCCPNGKYCCPHDYICDTLPMICRMPDGIKRADFNTNLFLQHIASKQRERGGKN